MRSCILFFVVACCSCTLYQSCKMYVLCTMILWCICSYIVVVRSVVVYHVSCMIGSHGSWYVVSQTVRSSSSQSIVYSPLHYQQSQQQQQQQCVVVVVGTIVTSSSTSTSTMIVVVLYSPYMQLIAHPYGLSNMHN